MGVIDDFEAFSGLQDLMGTELPANGPVGRCYTDIGVFTGQPVRLANNDEQSKHGTAVAETVMDIAPEVSLYIANAGTKGDLQSTADWMIAEGVSVINTSLSPGSL